MAKQWIAGAINHPGALHAQLGVPQDKKIPGGKLRAAIQGKYGATAKKRGIEARTLKRFH